MSTEILSNEELAIKIKQGETQYTVELWERVKKVLYMKISRYYNAHQDKFTSSGVTLEDLKQESYFIYIDMVNAFDETKGYKFNSYATYQMKNHFMRNILHISDNKVTEPLNISSSLDMSLQGLENDDLTLSDTIPDETALYELAESENSIYNAQISRIIKNAMDNALTPEEKQVIYMRYWGNMTIKQIAEKTNAKNIYEPRKQEEKAIKALQRYSHKDKKFFQLRENIITRHLYGFTSLQSFKNNCCSAPERAVEYLDYILTKHSNHNTPH